ncbi:RNA polymerase sigma factor SigM [Oxobacter pfennigii]|uniref:RNA polymerase sigma factor SigM n=2 Tax=Oxobacter pfennigii TaxID=36849 RepID=A0A0P8WKA0_9CLOT|nr:RNA polymerase sigma factor SigM [Oxobacter pfennigii]
MDNENMEALYAEYSQAVYRYLLSLCHSAQIAEELTQETFYRAILSSNRYNGNCKVSVWLCQIAKHLWYQHLRKEKNRTLPLCSISEPLTAPLETQLMEQENCHDLYVAIHALDEPYREVVYLRALGGLTFRQIGMVLGRSETWARVTFFRAKKQLMERRQSYETEL